MIAYSLTLLLPATICFERIPERLPQAIQDPKKDSGCTKRCQSAAQAVAGADDAVGLPASGQLLQGLGQVQVRPAVINDGCKLLQEACNTE